MAQAPQARTPFIPPPAKVRKSAESVAAEWLEEVTASLPPLHAVHPLKHVEANLPTLLKRLEER